MKVITWMCTLPCTTKGACKIKCIHDAFTPIKCIVNDEPCTWTKIKKDKKK